MSDERWECCGVTWVEDFKHCPECGKPRQAPEPEKATGERCSFYWGDQSKRCLLRPGHDGECTYPLTGKDVCDFTGKELDRLRAENAKLAEEAKVDRAESWRLNTLVSEQRERIIELESATVHGMIFDARMETRRVEKERDELRAKLDEAQNV